MFLTPHRPELYLLPISANNRPKNLLKKHLHWVIVCARFTVPTGVDPWRQCFHAIPSFQKIPPLLSVLFSAKYKKGKRELCSVGMGRLDQADVYSAGLNRIAGFSGFLGDNECFLAAPPLLLMHVPTRKLQV